MNNSETRDTMTEHAFTQRSADRNQQLDLLRAIAILSVIAYHVIGMSPVPMPGVAKFTHIGQYGVDLFFVLSGWLIGGLYWREQLEFGNVELWRFWSRRWLRTIPPYLVALLLSWLAVWTVRREPFDWRFLVFLQNYHTQIPFFLVSWSLCIEEHFYVFLPLILALPIRKTASVTIMFIALMLVAPVSRICLSVDGVDQAFGFEQTATHLRMEGLLLGFWLAFLSIKRSTAWPLAVRLSIGIIVGSVLMLAVAQYVSARWMYGIGYSTLALGLAGVLVFMIERKAGRIARWPWIKAVALASYSLYLTHPLMIHMARALMAKWPGMPLWLYFPLVLAMISVGGTVFYFAVERTSILLRDRWAPRRARAIKTMTAPGSEATPARALAN